MAWPHIFGNLTQAFMSYLDDNFNAAALLGGSATQAFMVANATAANQAVSMGQTVDFSNSNITSSVTITPAAFLTVVTNANGSSRTITLNPGTVPGQCVLIFGTGDATCTIESSVSTGSPSFLMPWGASIYSFQLFPSYSAGAEFIWDGSNWRVRPPYIGLAPFGAAASNAANQATVSLTTPSFTAPCFGIMKCSANASSTSGYITSIAISSTLATTSTYAATGWDYARALSYIECAPGDSGTITATVSCESGGGFTVYIDGTFAPR